MSFSALLKSIRLKGLLLTYLLTVLIFIVAKVVFMLCYGSAHGITFGDGFEVIAHGLTLDLSTALYFLIVPFLVNLVGIWVRVPQGVLKVYFAIIALAFALAFVADASLYAFWNFKLDASCLQYLEHPEGITASVSVWYLLLRLLLTIALTWLIYKAYVNPVVSPSMAKTGRDSANPLSSRIVATVVHVLLMPLMVIGIRGGLGESTTNIGQVYYSQNQFLNHAAVNPVFSFLSSLSKSGKSIIGYHFFDDAEVRRLTDGLFDTGSLPADTLLTTTRPNIVIIVMESCGGQFTYLGGRSDVMPRLAQLSREGISFTECYANSWRTDKGLVSILSGYPAFPVTSVMKIPEKSRLLPSLASSLKDEGYATGFYYGGDINFTNMRSYVIGTGYGTLKWKSDYTSDEQHSAQWGVRDDIMFSSLLADIRNEQSPRWMKTLLTLSSHEPWDVPTHRLEDPVDNAFNYLDECLGQFVDALKQTTAWQNTLVVILPDHGFRYKGIDETTRLYNHVPMLWVGGAVRAPRTVDIVCNQSDLPATLLGQMQMDHSVFTFSRDVLSDTYRRPMAYHTYNNGFTVFDADGFAAYDLDANTVIAGEGPRADSLLRIGRALLQLTSEDLKSKR